MTTTYLSKPAVEYLDIAERTTYNPRYDTKLRHRARREMNLAIKRLARSAA